MTLRDVLRKKDVVANAPSSPPVPDTPTSPISPSFAARTSSGSNPTQTATPIPEVVIVRTDTQTEEIIEPPEFPDDDVLIPGPSDVVNLTSPPRESRTRRLSNLLRGKSPSPSPSPQPSASISTTPAHEAAAARGAHNAAVLSSIAATPDEDESQSTSEAVGKLEKRISNMLHLKHKRGTSDEAAAPAESERERRRRSAREPSPTNAPSDLPAAPLPVRLGADELEDEARWERRATLLIEGSARSRSASASRRSDERDIAGPPPPYPIAAEIPAPASGDFSEKGSTAVSMAPLHMATGIGSPSGSSSGIKTNEGDASAHSSRPGLSRNISDAVGDVSTALHSNPVLSM